MPHSASADDNNKNLNESEKGNSKDSLKKLLDSGLRSKRDWYNYFEKCGFILPKHDWVLQPFFVQVLRGTKKLIHKRELYREQKIPPYPGLTTVNLIKFAVEQNPETATYLPDEYMQLPPRQKIDRQFCNKVFSHTIPDKIPLLVDKYCTKKNDLQALKQKVIENNFQLCTEMREVLDTVKVNPRDLAKVHHKNALFKNLAMYAPERRAGKPKQVFNSISL